MFASLSLVLFFSFFLEREGNLFVYTTRNMLNAERKTGIYEGESLLPPFPAISSSSFPPSHVFAVEGGRGRTLETAFLQKSAHNTLHLAIYLPYM